MNTTRISKFLSFVLRHEPQSIGIELDSEGWVNIDTLLAGMVQHGHRITRFELEHVVNTNEKKRFAFSPDGTMIRANQGHTTEVNLTFKSSTPPDILYHGTVAPALEHIRRDGLSKMQRHHVHLSSDVSTAMKVGGRRGNPIILSINAKQMHDDGYQFFLSENNVWLVDSVPVQYIAFS